MWATAVVCAVAVTAAIAILPLSTLYLAGLGISGVAFAAAPWVKRDGGLLPVEIHDPGLRDTFLSIVMARGELELALEDAPGMAPSARSLSERCREAVQLCARVAPVANRLYSYLALNDTWRMARDAALLRARSVNARDDVAAHNFAAAAAAYDRQLATCDELALTRDRIQSRLDLVLASLRSFTAAVIRQQTVEDEQLALAGESFAEQVNGVREELAVLETALAG